jgi:hypothetical protein
MNILFKNEYFKKTTSGALTGPINRSSRLKKVHSAVGRRRSIRLRVPWLIPAQHAERSSTDIVLYTGTEENTDSLRNAVIVRQHSGGKKT